MTAISPLSIDEIQAILQKGGYTCQYQGDPDLVIDALADPGSYEIGAAIWLGDMRYLKLPEGASVSDVTLVLIASTFEGQDNFQNILICDDPRNAFMCLAESACEHKETVGISSLASVSPSAVIAEDVSIGPWATIEDGVSIGRGTRVYSHAVIKQNAVIGEDCLIMEGCIIGGNGYGFRKKEDDSLVRFPHIGGVFLGDRVEVGPHSNIDRGTFRTTSIGNGTKIDALTCIGHNVCIGEDCMIIGGIICGNTSIGNRCKLTHVTVKNRIEIGDDVVGGIGSVIIKDVPNGVEVFGNPARIIKCPE